MAGQVAPIGPHPGRDDATLDHQLGAGRGLPQLVPQLFDLGVVTHRAVAVGQHRVLLAGAGQHTERLQLLDGGAPLALPVQRQAVELAGRGHARRLLDQLAQDPRRIGVALGLRTPATRRPAAARGGVPGRPPPTGPAHGGSRRSSSVAGQPRPARDGPADPAAPPSSPRRAPRRRGSTARSGGDPTRRLVAPGPIHRLSPGGRRPRAALVDPSGGLAGETSPAGVPHHRPLALADPDDPSPSARARPRRGLLCALGLREPPGARRAASTTPPGARPGTRPARLDAAGTRPAGARTASPSGSSTASSTRGSLDPTERRESVGSTTPPSDSTRPIGATDDGLGAWPWRQRTVGPRGRKRRTGPRRAPFKEKSGGDLLSQGVSPQVPSARVGLTSVFGMGTGVTPPLWPPKSVVKDERDQVTPGARALEELHSEHERHCRSKPSAD